MRTQRRAWLVTLALVLAALIVLPTAAQRLTDWMWYREVGLEQIFLTKIATQWALGLSVGAAALAFLWANLRVARRSLIVAAASGLGRGDNPLRLAFPAVLGPLAVIVSLVVALVAASGWIPVLTWWHAGAWGAREPVFGRDLGYYVFTLPVLDGALSLVANLAWLALIVVALPMYLFTGDIRVGGGRRGISVSPTVDRHVGALVALLFVVRALDLWLVRAPSLLYATTGPFVGASYADLHATLPALRVMTVVALLCAAAVVWGAMRRRMALHAAGAVAAYVALGAVLLGAMPAAYHKLVVQPNELAREAPQIVSHLAATRAAWGLDSVTTRELHEVTQLTAADIAANGATMRNVRLWDRDPLLQTYGQLQSIRTYYDFKAVDDDRYRIGGEPRQVLLSARELDTDALPTRSFINEHLTYTHGMGVALSPSNQVTEEGLPVLWVKDVPPVSSVSVQITRPQIYFGEESGSFALAPTRQREFDAPAGQGESDRFTSYAGRGGVPASGFFTRLLLALRFGSLNVLLSGDVTDRTRALYNRRIGPRAELAFPFLRFDDDPYIVVTDSGHLKWVLDGYTTTDRYPYAQRLSDGTSYVRNSVKVVIDAYDGDITAYLADARDPIIRTYASIYPGVLRPLAEMPADLRAHLRYPIDLFRWQAALYATYHMRDAEEFYHREDQWQVPAAREEDRKDPFMRHLVMRLPGEPRPEFILMQPFTPRQKDNLSAWMVARNDGAHYGELVAYRFPRQSLVYGPRQVINRINQDTAVSRQISLWDQRGSEVIWGDLLVIPVEQSLIYVQPLYLRAQGGRIPEMKQVVVAYENRLVMEESLEAGLTRLFGAGTVAAADTLARAAAPNAAASAAPAAQRPAADAAALFRQANDLYRRAIAAQRAGNWALYGATMDSLGAVLQRVPR